MATVVKCDICGGIHEDRDDNFKSIIRCNISDYIDLDICEECMNKIKSFLLRYQCELQKDSR